MEARAADMGVTMDEFDSRYRASSGRIARSTVVALIPIVALLSSLFHVIRERRFGVHLGLATHLVTFFLLVPDFLLMGLILPLFRTPGVSGPGAMSELGSYVLLATPVLLLGTWWYRADRRVFSTSRVGATLRVIASSICFWVGGMVAHQYLTFRLTMRSLE